MFSRAVRRPSAWRLATASGRAASSGERVAVEHALQVRAGWRRVAAAAASRGAPRIAVEPARAARAGSPSASVVAGQRAQARHAARRLAPRTVLHLHRLEHRDLAARAAPRRRQRRPTARAAPVIGARGPRSRAGGAVVVRRAAIAAAAGACSVVAVGTALECPRRGHAAAASAPPASGCAASWRSNSRPRGQRAQQRQVGRQPVDAGIRPARAASGAPRRRTRAAAAWTISLASSVS